MTEWSSLPYLPEMALRFGLAVILSGALGLERQRKGRSAGLRTHILVCLGSTLAVTVGDLLAREAGPGVLVDKGRIAAGVVTGVGFLGAGTIVLVGGEHRGLTTAAMVWFAAALGIGLGCGYYLIPVLATAFALITVMGLERFERLMPSEAHYRVLIRLPRGPETLDEVEKFLRGEGCWVSASRLEVGKGGSHVNMTFEITSMTMPELDEIAERLQARFSAAEQIVFER